MVDGHVATEADGEISSLEHGESQPGQRPGIVKLTGAPSRRGLGGAKLEADQNKRFQRLFWIGTSISEALISRTSSGTPQAKAGSTLILKWYMSCMAW